MRRKRPTTENKVKVAQSYTTLCDPMEFSRPEYWSGKPFPSPGDLPNSGIEPVSLTLQVDSLPSEPPVNPTESKAQTIKKIVIGSHILIITLNVNRLNAPTKTQMAEQMKTCACMYFHLPHHSAWPPQIICNYFILLG